jgi:hypothetical protein
VTVPAGSANPDTTLTIAEFNTADPNLPPPPSGFDLLGQVIGVSTDPPATFSPENPTTLVISYDQSIVPPGADEATLPVFHATGSIWQPVGEPCSDGVSGQPLNPDPCISARDTVNNTITIKTSHFSLFGLGAPKVIKVQIDIKPGSFSNPVNLRAKGVIPVAVLTTSVFDARTVDTATVRFAGASAARCVPADVDGDDDVDLLCYFRIQDTKIKLGDTQACLEGETWGGIPIKGCDSIRIVAA